MSDSQALFYIIVVPFCLCLFMAWDFFCDGVKSEKSVVKYHLKDSCITIDLLFEKLDNARKSKCADTIICFMSLMANRPLPEMWSFEDAHIIKVFSGFTFGEIVDGFKNGGWAVI